MMVAFCGNADERARHLAVEAVHDERVPVDGAAHEHRREVERVAIVEGRERRRPGRRERGRVHALAGKKDGHGRREADQTRHHHHPRGHGNRHRHRAVDAVAASPRIPRHGVAWAAGRRSARRASATTTHGQARAIGATHCVMPRNSGWVRNDWSHPLGEVPCSTVGPACVAGTRVGLGGDDEEELVELDRTDGEVPLSTAPSRTHCVRSGVAAQAT